MTTLGQILKVNQDAKRKALELSPEELEAQRAAQLKQKIESMTRVVEQAKRDVTRAILSNIDAIESKVPMSEPAFDYLHRITRGVTSRVDQELQSIWEELVNWGRAENLHITFKAGTAPSEAVGGAMLPHILVKASPMGV